MKHMIISDVAPSAAPTQVGQHWVKTTDPTGEWFSTGTVDVSDWQERGAGGGGGTFDMNLVEQQFDFGGEWQLHPGVNGIIGASPAALVPNVTAGRAWIIPFYIPQAFEMNSFQMTLAGTLPATINVAVQKQTSEELGYGVGESLLWFAAATPGDLNAGVLMDPPVLLPEPGVYLAYVQLPATSTGLTARQVTQPNFLTGAGSPLDNIMTTLRFGGYVGMTRSLVGFNASSTPNPFTEETSVGASAVPFVAINGLRYIAP